MQKQTLNMLTWKSIIIYMEKKSLIEYLNFELFNWNQIHTHTTTTTNYNNNHITTK